MDSNSNEDTAIQSVVEEVVLQESLWMQIWYSEYIMRMMNVDS